VDRLRGGLAVVHALPRDVARPPTSAGGRVESTVRAWT
jgi:hypothetical protein